MGHAAAVTPTVLWHCSTKAATDCRHGQVMHEGLYMFIHEEERGFPEVLGIGRWRREVIREVNERKYFTKYN